MAGKIESLIKYENKIHEVPIDRIEINPLNPRKRFVEDEEDELIESIISKGVLNPIVVFRRDKDGKYTILDGERRYRACKKLNIIKIRAIILVREPTNLENLSMMFHIHNVREEWTDFAVSITIKKIIEEAGWNIKKLKTQEIKELSRITSLSNYKIKKYLRFLEYPKEVINRFLESERNMEPNKGLDPDILAEMHNPIRLIKSQIPEILKQYSIPKIIDVCIRKKAGEVVKKNKEFRFLSKALMAVKRGEIPKELLKDKIIDFLEKTEVTPEKIYTDTRSETVYQIKHIGKVSEDLYEEINNISLRKLTNKERGILKKKLLRLAKLIETKFLR